MCRRRQSRIPEGYRLQRGRRRFRKSTAAADFHAAIATAQAENQKDPAYRDDGYRSHPIVGCDQPTFQSALVSAGKTTLLRRHGDRDYGGDGTVPLVSAAPLELREEGREIVAAECHGSLQNFDAVLSQIVGAAKIQQVDYSQYRARFATELKLSLGLDDVYPANTPNEVTVRPSAAVPALTAIVQEARSGRSACRIDFRPSADKIHCGRF
jgi:hypothetical protein